MNMEIANRLVKLRKQAGLSQEELAEKLGISRQAISKWECGEASPDTDNLIALAQLYGVSLDELLLGKEKDDENPKQDNNNKTGKSIDLGNGAIHVETEKGEKVHISGNQIHVVDEDGQEININGSGIHINPSNDNRTDEQKRKDRIIYGALSGILYALALTAYLLLGFLLNMWSTMWILFFVPDIILSLYKAIRNKRPKEFNITFVSLFVFFLICLVLFPEQKLWHPMWAVFLAIPLYYVVVGGIESLVEINKNKKNNIVIEEKVDE